MAVQLIQIKVKISSKREAALTIASDYDSAGFATRDFSLFG